MTEEVDDQHLAEHRRKEIFRAIVDAQDQGIDVAQSRRLAMERFGISESRIQQIEREGMDHNWPPL